MVVKVLREIKVIRIDVFIGYDQFLVKYQKFVVEYIVGLFVYIINFFIKILLFLDVWKVVRVSLIFKVNYFVKNVDMCLIFIFLVFLKVYEKFVYC